MYYGIKDPLNIWTALVHSETANPTNTKKLNVAFDINANAILAAAGELPALEFYWTDSRVDFKVGHKDNGFLGIGNYDDQLRDSITLGTGFSYSGFKAYGFTIAVITVDTDIREEVDGWVDVSLLKSNGAQIGTTQTFDPDDAAALNTWKDHYIYFSRNVPLDDIKDGKFIIRYSARGADNNAYWVGTARVTVTVK
ncbi:hypothetical protein AGMMS49944_25380 [Spirochaetia bacterium]|nr:hypothetical protein AGMMS49944_25380 [Spirochaetia bacterium]